MAKEFNEISDLISNISFVTWLLKTDSTNSLHWEEWVNTSQANK